MNALPFHPVRQVPPESFGAVVQNRHAAIEHTVRTAADMRNAPDADRERAIDAAIAHFRAGFSAASAVEVGMRIVRGAS